MNIEKFILLSNDDYFLVNKAPGISVLENRNSPDNWLKMAREKFETARACHRIDIDTSGVLVFSKHDAAYRHLALAFQHRRVRKIYHALVHGVPVFQEKLVDLPIKSASSGKGRVDRTSGKPAKTHFRVLERFADYALMECLPISGRRHQIRVHLHALGHPVVADGLYGGMPLLLSEFKRGYHPSGKPERPLITRSALHAYMISFDGVAGEQITAQAAYPKDLRVSLDQLRKAKGQR